MQVRWPTPALLLAVALLGCGGTGQPPPSADLSVELKEWTVIPSKAQLPPGRTTILVKNVGTIAHDFVVIRTELAPERLPVEGAMVREDGKVAKTAAINPGGSTTLTVELAAGSYVLICNQPGHYASGMRTSLAVR